MQSDKERIAELERRLAEMETWAGQFQSAAQLDSQIARTIRTIAGLATLEGLSDVNFSGLISGQVLEYNGTEWVNATDNT